MYTRSLIICCLVVVFSCNARLATKSASPPDEDLTKYMYKPKVEQVTKDATKETITTPVKFEKEINANLKQVIDSMIVSNRRYQSAEGYRIMVYSGGSSDESARAKKSIYDWSTEYDVYVQYKQPAFRVNVGNFPDRVKAYDVLSDVIRIFPNAVIIPDQIEIK